MTLVAQRPAAGPARPFTFPEFTRTQMPNGLTLIVCDLPGRPLCTATLITEAGPATEDPTRAGLALLTARALQEGTTERDATAFADGIEALGADLSISVASETMHASVRAPATRLSDAVLLMAEAITSPALPGAGVDRLVKERLGQIAVEREVGGVRAMEAFISEIYTPESAYSRPTGGTATSVELIDRAAIQAHHASFVTPTGATLIVAGDLQGLDAEALAEKAFGAWSAGSNVRPTPVVEASAAGRRVTIVDRPGSPQSNLVIGHVGVSRSVPDHSAVEMVEHVYGGSFSCRLNTRLREEKGYTYGARGSFDMRRHPGPFWSAAPVETSVTVPAIVDTVEIISEMAASGITEEELVDTRRELAGAYGLRFETAEAVANGIAELTVHSLPDDTFDTYQARLDAVTLDQASAAAGQHIRPDDLKVVVVGDASVFGAALEAAGIGPVQVV